MLSKNGIANRNDTRRGFNPLNASGKQKPLNLKAAGREGFTSRLSSVGSTSCL